jgi:putative membrane protein
LKEEKMDLYGLRPLAMLSVVVYSAIGFAVFAVAFYIMAKISPISIAKEIEEDQNVALAILMGSIFISLAIIIQAAIRG